jgi:hypothetical protein
MQDEQNGQQITIANISLPVYIQGFTNPFYNSEKKIRCKRPSLPCIKRSIRQFLLRHPISIWKSDDLHEKVIYINRNIV